MNRNRTQLLLIILAFALPAAVAVLLQTRWFHWNPESTRNRGDLIKPVVGIATDDASRALFANGERWTVMVRFPAECPAECARRMILLSHIREAQGKEMDRVQMVAWAPSGTELDKLWIDFNAPPPRLGTAASHIEMAESETVIVDPFGNAMLRFGAHAEPTDVRKDLAHLLRWTKAGQ